MTEVTNADPEPDPATSAASGEFVVVNQLGLHARAATKLVQLAARFEAEIELEREGQAANAKSVMGVLLLCGSRGTTLRVQARGRDAREAVEALGKLIADGFGELP